jgi:hypothetical protein
MFFNRLPRSLLGPPSLLYNGHQRHLGPPSLLYNGHQRNLGPPSLLYNGHQRNLGPPSLLYNGHQRNLGPPSLLYNGHQRNLGPPSLLYRRLLPRGRCGWCSHLSSAEDKNTFALPFAFMECTRTAILNSTSSPALKNLELLFWLSAGTPPGVKYTN